MATLCVILARAGSKGLPNKNVLPLGGRPMIAWTIDHARAARSVDDIIVTTDGPEIAAAAHAMGVTVIERPAGLAGDTATVDAAARHAVEAHEDRTGRSFDVIVLLYANVPLRPADLIDRSIAKLRETGCDSVQSLAPVGKMHPYWMKTLGGAEHDRIEPYQPNAVYRRQDLPPVYMLDGGIIAVTRQALFTQHPGEPHAFLGSDRRAVLTEPGEVVDIDGPADLALAEAHLDQRQSHPGPVHIGDRTIGDGHPTYVIAELGVNHDGSLDRALALTDAAMKAGADAVKLQLFDARLLLSAEAKFANYQRDSASDPFEMLDRLQLSAEQMHRVRQRAHEHGLGFIVTCFSLELIEAMRQLDVDAVKLASPDCVNHPLVEGVLALSKPVLASVGTATQAEVAALHGQLGSHPSVVMQCVSCYPVPEGSEDLGRIRTVAAPGRPRGYSDHTTDVLTGALAVAAGANVIEKHLTYDRHAAGPDHAASFDPSQFSEYVQLIRRADHTMGLGGDREPLPCERDVATVSRQSVCAAIDLPSGHVIARADVTVKRPGTGIPAAALKSVVGRRLTRTVEANQLLKMEDLKD